MYTRQLAAPRERIYEKKGGININNNNIITPKKKKKPEIDDSYHFVYSLCKTSFVFAFVVSKSVKACVRASEYFDKLPPTV